MKNLVIYFTCLLLIGPNILSCTTGISSITPSRQTISVPELRVGKSRSNFQGEASVAMNETGNSVITWAAVEEQSINIYAQVLNNGQPAGEEIRVNTKEIPVNESNYKPSIKFLNIVPAVEIANNGNFIISWINHSELLVRKFDKSGKPLSEETNPKLNIKGKTLDIERAVRQGNIISLNDDGSSFINSRHPEKYGQLYDKDFNPVNDSLQFPVDTSTIYPLNDKKWDTLFVFPYYDQTLHNFFLSTQKLNKTNSQISSEVIKLKELGSNPPMNTGITANKSGSLVYAEAKSGNNYPDWDIYANIYDANNNHIKEFKVNSKKLNIETSPFIKAAINDNGDFVIAWGELIINHALGDISARAFNKNGEPKGEQFKINYLSKGFKAKPDISMNNKGDIIIAWPNWNDNQSEYQIYSRKYNIYQDIPEDNPALIPSEKVNCEPSAEQLAAIMNLERAAGELKIKVKADEKIIELNSLEAFQRLPDIKDNNGEPGEVKINGKRYEHFSTGSFIVAPKKSGCLDALAKPYSARGYKSANGFYRIIPDHQKTPVNKIEELVRKFSIAAKIEIKEIEFSSPRALSTFALYLDMKLNYPYLYDLIFLNRMATY